MKKFLWIGMVGFAFACSDDAPQKAKVGEACNIDPDCQDGLLCRGSICVEPAQTNNDVGTNNDVDVPDMEVPIENEEFYISYLIQDLLDNTRSLRVLDTQTGTKTRVSPDGYNCFNGCWVTDDLTRFYALNTNADKPGTFDVVEFPVMNLKATGEGNVIITAVRGVRVVGNTLTYIREENEINSAYYWDGAERPVGPLGGAQATQGDWQISSDAELAVTYRATLQTMDVLVGELGAIIDTPDKIYTINAENYQEVAGSYFGGNVPTAISKDGKRLAMITASAPLDTNACTDASQCTGPGERCGRFGRCASIKVAVHMFDLENSDNLGKPCSGNAACGPIHVCDIPSDTQLDLAVCIPRPVVLGLPGQQTQGNPARPGCELTQGNDDLFYTGARSPISFGPDGNVYVVADRDCNDFNIPAAGVLRISPTTGQIDMVYGNKTENYDVNLCYDPIENTPSVEQCVTYIDSVHLSPNGNKIAFLATNPYVVDYELAKSTLDIWVANRDGSNFKWLGNHGELEAVRAIRTHPKP